MQVVFVGGAHHIGASCEAVQLADQWFVIDAGVQVGQNNDPLPDFSLLEGKPIQAIFVTHAHADHIGALPLLHRMFPATPIYTSRATALLMEVMLSDALHVMEKRAAEEMEFPLYPASLIASMLRMVRPIPIGSPFTVPELAHVTITANRAGHVAGAVGFGFTAADGSLVVSGDISMTPQRSLLGAEVPPVKQPDLLILESTYGARLHANRQAEELRMAQAVAQGLSEGGHVLIPAFGLGRGQEVILILRAAQEKGQIPLFPIYIDGLIRRVCATYMLVPEALSPVIQRQIRKGYAPFNGGDIQFVQNQQHREKILAGPPSCIISSSGMLTGGPSAWYAQRLVENPHAAIFLTGYQDEEAPGRKLLNLVDKKETALDLNGQSYQVRCQVEKYNLSAHADGSELATYASILKPRHIALVHGDESSRLALSQLLTETGVLLPVDGQTVDLHPKTTLPRSQTVARRAPVSALPQGIGNGKPFTIDDMQRLWQTIKTVPSLRIVTARELALTWYGEASEAGMQQIISTLNQDWDQRYFVPQHALQEAYRVRGQIEETPGDFLTDLIDSVVLLQVSPESTKPAICREIQPGASVRVQLPRTISTGRNRYPFSAIIDVLGPYQQETSSTNQLPSTYLGQLIKEARQIRRHISAHQLAQSCQEDVDYTLGDLCQLAGVSSHGLAERLAVAKVIYKHPLLFVQQKSFLDGEGLAHYQLAPEWRDGLLYPEKRELPDQNEILQTIECYIGNPPDLYRRSVNPETGDVMLHFYFPGPAQGHYGDALASAAEEAAVNISISLHAHQEELVRLARLLLPPGLTEQGRPSLYPETLQLVIRYNGNTDEEQITQAQDEFQERTGWYLYYQSNQPATPVEQHNVQQQSEHTAPNGGTRVAQHEALIEGQRLFSSLPDCYKVGIEIGTSTLLLRFHFPNAAQHTYAQQIEHYEQATGWNVRIHPNIHQGALIALAQNILPDKLTCRNTPSLHQGQRKVVVTYQGDLAEDERQAVMQAFKDQTDWELELKAPALPAR